MLGRFSSQAGVLIYNNFTGIFIYNTFLQGYIFKLDYCLILFSLSHINVRSKEFH